MTDQEPNPATNTNNPTNQQQKGPTNPAPKPALASGKIHTPETSAEPRKSGNEDKHWLDYATGVFAFIAAIGGGVAGIAGSYQAWVAKDTEIVSNRAFVVSNTVRFITYDAPVEGNDADGTGPRTWIVSPKIENAGNTPTKNARAAVSVGFDTVNDARFDGYKRSTSYVPISIGPKWDVSPSGFELKNVRLFDVQWGIMGIIKYDDIFGKPHISEFCYNAGIPPFDFHRASAGQPIYSHRIIQCAHHNCTDDECGPDWEQRAKQ
jgi:hypothetical protein